MVGSALRFRSIFASLTLCTHSCWFSKDFNSLEWQRADLTQKKACCSFPRKWKFKNGIFDAVNLFSNCPFIHLWFYFYLAVNQKLREEEGEDLDKVAKDVDLQEEALRVHRLKSLGPSASSIYHIIYHIYTISEQLVHFFHLLGSITVNFTLSRQDDVPNMYWRWI